MVFKQQANNGSVGQQVVFFKLKETEITDENFHTTVCVTSMPDPLNGLYHSVKKVIFLIFT